MTTSNLEKHLEALQIGLQSAIYVLSGRVDLKRLGRHYNMIIKRRHPDIADSYRHFTWFRTGEDVTVCYVGSDMFFLDAVEDYMSVVAGNRIAAHVQLVFAGRNKERFMGELKARLQQYTPSPSKRSYGGSQLGHN